MLNDNKIFHSRYSLPNIASQRAFKDVDYILNRIKNGDYDLRNSDIVIDVYRIPKGVREDDNGKF